MKTWAKGVNMGQEFAVNNIVCFYGSESRFVIHNDPGAKSPSKIRDPKIVTLLIGSQTFKVAHTTLFVKDLKLVCFTNALHV